MSFNNDVVEIRVQGLSFSLERSFVLGVDWILSKIIACDALSSINTRKICIDVDSLSFRLVLSVLQGTVRLSDDEMDRLTSSPTEFMLFKNTVTHLHSESLLRVIEEYEEASSKSVFFASPKKSKKKFKFDCAASKIVFRDIVESDHCTALVSSSPSLVESSSKPNSKTKSSGMNRSNSSSSLLFSGVLECWA